MPDISRNVNIDSLGKSSLEVQPREVLRAQAVQVIALDLAVDQAEAPAAKNVYQRDQCDFGRIVAPAEHGFPEKYTAECHAIQPAEQRAPCIEDLDTVCVAQAMQR